MAEDFTAVMPETDLRDGSPVRAESPWGPLLVYKHDQHVYAISNVCTHMGAPLHRGPINTQTTMPLATCPAHGSMFDLATGTVRRGPAMKPVAAYEAKVDGDRVVARPVADAPG
jgi:nitrite reductase/ring-hydroxylating ferredoxin subunit